MERKTIPLRRFSSFGFVALMLFHMFLCIMSDRRWQFDFEGSASTALIAGIYLIPVLIIFGLTTFMVFSKSHTARSVVVPIKFFVSCLTSCFIWLLMIMAYHNPTNSDWVFINCSTLFMVLFAFIFLILERKIIKERK